MKNANEKQQLLNININWKIYNMVDYFQSIYKKMKKIWNSFEEIMKEFVKLFLEIEDQIIAKHKIYNEFWSSSNDKEISKKNLEDKWYLDPIIL
jgi:hypothetical protein